MTTIALDTHKIVKRFKDAGFSEAQAEVMTDVIKETQETGLDDVVTNGSLKVTLAEALSPMKADVSLLKWMLGFLLALASGILFKMFS